MGGKRCLVRTTPQSIAVTFPSGLSRKPSLLSHQGHILNPGMSLTLQCYSGVNYGTFALYKVGEADIIQSSSQWTKTGLSMANFTLDYVSDYTGGQYRCYGTHNLSSELSASSDPLDILITGTYRCYGSQDSSLYLLTFASPPVELIVSESIEASSWPTKRFFTRAGPENRDHTMENLIRIGMAVLVLIVLLILAAEAWQSHKQAHHAAGK